MKTVADEDWGAWGLGSGVQGSRFRFEESLNPKQSKLLNPFLSQVVTTERPVVVTRLGIQVTAHTLKEIGGDIRVPFWGVPI